MTAEPRTAVHCTIVVVDIEAFGDQRRTMQHQLHVREGLYEALQEAFDTANIPWRRCYHEDRGDGVLILAPADLPKARVIDRLPRTLVAALHRHNTTHPAVERIRLRVAVHAGEVAYDRYGVTASSINLAFRLLEAPSLKAALAMSPGTLALIVSGWLFDEVVRHSPGGDPATWRRIMVTVKETMTAGWISLPDHPYPPSPGVLGIAPVQERGPVPDQLPGSPRWFTGRASELATLTAVFSAAMQETAGDVATVVISAICGAGGMGKTWLALQWAHRHRDRFPDGVLYVNLHGFDPDDAPMPAATVIHGFLGALGVDSTAIPADLAAQTGLYRSLLTSKRMLIVLDNARDTSQVIPLLPGSSTCAVLVTSRHHLGGLVTAHSAHLLDLDVLADHDAYQLLARRLGRQRVAAEPNAVADLLAYCAGLPLALSIVAAQAALHPHFPLASVAAELEDQAHRVDALDAGDATTTVRAALSWSTQTLSADANAAFVLLGRIPGPDINLPAAARLLAQSTAAARRLLRELEHASLINQHIPGRYRMHDLVRLYAATCTDYPAADCEAAVRRLTGFYVHTACIGEQRFRPHDTPITIDLDSLTAGSPHPLVDGADALRWFDAEHACLLATQQAAAARGWHSVVWQLAWALNTFHMRRGHIHDDLAMWQAGLTAAARLTNPIACIVAHRRLGLDLIQTGRLNDGRHHLQQALTLAESLGDLTQLAHVHHTLGWAWTQQGQHDQATRHTNRALRLFQQIGDTIWEANVLNTIGWYAAVADKYDRAEAHCRTALTLHRQRHDHDGEAATLDNLGYIAHHTGHHRQAVELYQQALTLDQALGHTRELADILDRLGHPHLALGHFAQARTAWTQALALYQTQLRTGDAIRVQQQLDTLDAHPPGETTASQ